MDNSKELLKSIKNTLIGFSRYCFLVFTKDTTWTVVINEIKKPTVDGKSEWIRELNFQYGDLRKQDIDYETDWRFCEVKDKRKQVEVVGITRTKFPIKYPLWLTNGKVIKNNQ